MKRLILLSLALLLSVGCASPNAKTDASNVSQATSSPDESAEVESAPDAKSYVTDAAVWFPADTILVAGMTAEQYWSLAADFFPKGRRSLDDDGPGTAGGLKADLRAVMLERMGVDLTGLQGAAFGLGHDSGSVVLFGDIELAEDRFEPETIDGVDVLSYRIKEAVDVSADDQIWVVRFDSPRDGVAAFASKDHLRRALEARASSDESGSELTSEKANLDVPLYENLPSGSFVAMATLDKRVAEMLDGMPFPAPDQAGLSYGDGVTVIMEGSAASLDGASRFIKQYRAMAEQQVQLLKRRADRDEGPESVSMLIGYHYAFAYLETFEEERTEGRLRYSVATPDTGVTLMGPGVVAAIAIPAFLKYIKRSKSAEASGLLRKMADGAKSYYVSDQKGCKGQKNCWHPSAQPGVPVSFKQKVFPGGTNVHIVSTPKPPSNGEKQPALPGLGSGHGATVTEVEPILDALGMSFSDPTYFQYVYETGPGRGKDATATITAIADFDGDGAPNHTVEMRLVVDDQTYEVRIGPAVTTHEFE